MKKRVVKLNPHKADGVTRRGRGTRAGRLYKMKKNFWQISGIEPSEVDMCLLLIVGSVFHGSEYGERLKRMFDSGHTLTVTVTLDS